MINGDPITNRIGMIFYQVRPHVFDVKSPRSIWIIGLICAESGILPMAVSG